MAGAAITSTAGTGTIPQQSKTPGDIFMEQLLTSVVAPTVNSMLDISATTTGTGTAATTGTRMRQILRLAPRRLVLPALLRH